MTTDGRTAQQDAMVETGTDDDAIRAEDRAERGDAVVANETDENGRPTATSEPERVDSDDSELVPLLDRGDADEFRGRWNDLQTDFVDHPREVVEQADELVDELMKRLSAQFAEERSRLEGQWDRDEDVSTEELRVALTRYRSFFERLLAA
jgi:hypothetical protein